ncbi:MAG TPA: hypothetical protein VF783_26990, partial [Terriglobales bacterium]
VLSVDDSRAPPYGLTDIHRRVGAAVHELGGQAQRVAADLRSAPDTQYLELRRPLCLRKTTASSRSAVELLPPPWLKRWQNKALEFSC